MIGLVRTSPGYCSQLVKLTEHSPSLFDSPVSRLILFFFFGTHRCTLNFFFLVFLSEIVKAYLMSTEKENSKTDVSSSATFESVSIDEIHER